VEAPPRVGGMLHRRGTREVDPAGRGGLRGRGLPPNDYSIAPTEFPERRSAAGHSGLSTAVPGSMRPSGGGSRSPVNAARRILAKALPPGTY